VRVLVISAVIGVTVMLLAPVARGDVATSDATAPRAGKGGQASLRGRYVLAPHPDNELESWAIGANDSAHYIVFVLFTHGEETSFCDGHGLQADLGERTPEPQPFTGRLTPNCDGERIDSWNAFLDGMASVNTNLDIPAPIGHFEGAYDPKRVTPTRCDARQCSPSAGYDAWAGARTARFILNLGDCALTADEVT